MSLKFLRGMFVGLALGGSAMAAPVLKSEVQVTAAVVTVGDMFEDAGALAETALFRAPAPGTSGIVSLDAVRQAATLAGLTDFNAEGVLRVRVARNAVAVDEPMLTGLIVSDLTSRGIITGGVTAVATYDQRDLSFNAEAGTAPLTLADLRYMPGSGGFTARFVIAGHDAPLDLSGRIELMVEAPHLASSLRAGTVLQASDIEMKPVPLKFAESAGYAELDQVVGKALVRQSRVGMVLKPSDVSEPAMVSRNDAVTIYFRNGPLTLTVKGQALGAATRGEAVQVLNLMSRKVLSAVAIGAGAVEISTPSLNVAGL